MTPARRTFLLTLALAAGGCDKRADPPLAPAPPAVQVQAGPAQALPVARALALTGSLVANRQAEVAANAVGQVMRTFVERGDYVKAGAPLVQLDVRGARLSETEARANAETARAQHELADAQCQRNRALFEKGAISRDEWDRASTACRTGDAGARAAEARADLAQKNLGDATVRAPFAGMIGERFVNVGEYVDAKSRVASLVELSPLRLQLTVAEADVGLVKNGQAVDFEVQAFPGETFHGRVRYIGPSVRAATRDLVVEAEVANADRRLRPGLFATARLRLPDAQAPAVPASALRREGEAARLFVVVNDHLEERVVQVGAPQGELVPVLDGLKPGELVVTQLGDQVRDGALVTSAGEK